jgi:hypothetical protein
MSELPSELRQSIYEAPGYSRKRNRMPQPLDPRGCPGWKSLKPQYQANKLRLYQLFLAKYRLQEARHQAQLRTMMERDKQNASDPTYREARKERQHLAYLQRKAKP